VGWRRWLWCGVAAALAWALYLFLPSRPRWVLPLHETPLYFSADRLVSAAVDRPRQGGMPVEYGARARNEIVGPVCLRDLRTGRVLSTAAGSGEGCLTLDITPDLRYLLAAYNQRTNLCVYDLVTGAKWTADDDAQVLLSPRGSLLAVSTADRVRLLDTASKEVVCEAAAKEPRIEMAPDDSWALFITGVHWLLWQRGREGMSSGSLPEAVRQCRVAADQPLAALYLAGSPRILIWDVLRGQARHEWRPVGLGSDLAVALADDGRHVAAWPLGDAGLEFFDCTTGKTASVPDAHVGLCHGFAPDGRSFAFVEGHVPKPGRLPAPTSDLVVVGLPGAKVWTRHPGVGSFDWVRTGGEDRLLVAWSTGDRADLIDAVTGPTGSSREGELSEDRRCLVSQSVVSLIEAHHLPERLGTWLKWLGEKNVLRVRVEDAAGGGAMLQLLRRSAEKEVRRVRTPYVTSDTLVLVSPDHAAEVWDLPGARRWEWIIGVPAALALLPWLLDLLRRRRPT
jgi:WD40 repeat protein